MKSLSKLFLLVVLLTTQQSILSMHIDDQQYSEANWYSEREFGMNIELIRDLKVNIEVRDDWNTTLRFDSKHKETVKIFIGCLYSKKSVEKIEVSNSAQTYGKEKWTIIFKPFDLRNYDKMTPGIKAVTFVINLATRALEKC